jgi:integrase
VKSFLSGVFKHAKREGFLDGENPIRDVSAPGRPKKFKGPVYSMSDIATIVEAVAAQDIRSDIRSFAVVSVAAFTGLRLSELRGLRWKDYDGRSLHVGRSVWRTIVNETKMESSEASMPVLSLRQKVLNEHRARVKGGEEQYIFAGEKRGTPLNLVNLARRVIIPACQQYSEKIEESVQFKGMRSGALWLRT